MILLSDLAKDCIDAMRCSKDAIDRLVTERCRIGALAADPCEDRECGPALFRYSALDGGAHNCLFCNALTAPTHESLGVVPTYPSHCVVVCDACRRVI